MTIREAKDIICKDQLCWYEGLLNKCESSCVNCIYYIDPTVVQEAMGILHDYYVKKHVKSQMKDFMSEVENARIRRIKE